MYVDRSEREREVENDIALITLVTPRARKVRDREGWSSCVFLSVGGVVRGGSAPSLSFFGPLGASVRF